jgi:hypothetical protein
MIFRYEMRNQSLSDLRPFLERAHIPKTKQRQLEAHRRSANQHRLGQSSRALGYVMEVLPGSWMARVRNLGSDLLSFWRAKQEAIRLCGCPDKGAMDWIRQLNLRAAAKINRTALASEKRKAPVDLIGGERKGYIDQKIRAAVLDAEIGFLTNAGPENDQGRGLFP